MNKNNNLNWEILNTLSEEEKNLAVSMLKEFSQSGTSKIFDSVKWADWKEIPVDIETFLTDDRYLGVPWKDSQGNSKVYPFWMEQLKKLFPDNISTSVNNFIEYQ